MKTKEGRIFVRSSTLAFVVPVPICYIFFFFVIHYITLYYFIMCRTHIKVIFFLLLPSSCITFIQCFFFCVYGNIDDMSTITFYFDNRPTALSRQLSHSTANTLVVNFFVFIQRADFLMLDESENEDF